jgi:Tfp pilus assembly protein PilV
MEKSITPNSAKAMLISGGKSVTPSPLTSRFTGPPCYDGQSRYLQKAETYWTSFLMSVLRPSRPRRGFTLIEACLTTIIVGIGMAAMLQLLAAGTVNNIQAFETTTGSNVAKSIHEAMIQMTFSQILAMNGKTYTPPIDSCQHSITTLENWQQAVTVQPVSPDSLTQNVVDPSPDAVRVTVDVSHNGSQVCQVSWYSFKP